MSTMGREADALAAKRRKQERFKQARIRRDAFLDELEIMADWKEDLDRRIARFNLRWHYSADMEIYGHDELEREVGEYRAACYAMGRRPI